MAITLNARNLLPNRLALQPRRSGLRELRQRAGVRRPRRTPGSNRSTARIRDELLNSWRFDSLLEARVIIEDWRCDYNANRPHTARCQLTPTEFALQWTTTHQPQVA